MKELIKASSEYQNWYYFLLITFLSHPHRHHPCYELSDLGVCDSIHEATALQCTALYFFAYTNTFLVK